MERYWRKKTQKRIRNKISKIDTEKVSKEINISIGIKELKKSDDKDVVFNVGAISLYIKSRINKKQFNRDIPSISIKEVLDDFKK